MEKLDDKNFDCFRVVFNLKQALDVYRIIALNAGAINHCGAGKSFFIYAQQLALTSCIVDICKLVECEKKPYRLNSIPGVIEYIKVGKLAVKEEQPIIEFLKEYKLSYKKGKEADLLREVFDLFFDKIKSELSRLKEFRDKRLAHVEEISVSRKMSLPSYAAMEAFLKFGYSFYFAVQKAYIGSGPIDLEGENKVMVGLMRLLELKGIKDPKRDFEN